MKKYFALSKDNPDTFCHTPDKILIVLLKLKEKSENFKFKDSKEYASYYKGIIKNEDTIQYSDRIRDTFDNSVILNDYSDFIKRTYYISEGKNK